MSLVPDSSDRGSQELVDPKIKLDFDSAQDSEAESSTEKTHDEDYMKVFVRVRPLLKEEKIQGFTECFLVEDVTVLKAEAPIDASKRKKMNEFFTFTKAYNSEVGRHEFFEETMNDTIKGFIEGQNCLIFAYGNSGSGKTYTMQGTSSEPGIIPLTVQLLFESCKDRLISNPNFKPMKLFDISILNPDQLEEEMATKNELLQISDFEDNDITNSYLSLLNSIFLEDANETCDIQDTSLVNVPLIRIRNLCTNMVNQKKDVSCGIWVSFIEIYNEKVFDLLKPFTERKRPKLTLVQDKNGNIYAKGMQEVFVENSSEIFKLLRVGRKNLKMASTKLNEHSSRSHCIFNIKLVSFEGSDVSKVKVNNLSFCDLAGSERYQKTQNIGERLQEAGKINTSLLVLGRCIEVLRQNTTNKEKKLVPFRESKLTRLFSGFFTGKGKASMIVNISPSNYTFDETLNVLKFSAIARQVQVIDEHLSVRISRLSENFKNRLSSCEQSMNDSNLSTDTYDYEREIEERDGIIQELLAKYKEMAAEFEELKIEHARQEATLRTKYRKQCNERCDQTSKFYRKQMFDMQARFNKSELDQLKRMFNNIFTNESSSEGSDEEEEDEEEGQEKSTEVNTEKVSTTTELSSEDSLKAKAKAIEDLDEIKQKLAEISKERDDLSEANAKSIQDLVELNEKLAEISQEKTDLSKEFEECKMNLQQEVKELELQKQANAKAIEDMEKLKQKLAEMSKEKADLSKEFEESQVNWEQEATEIEKEIELQKQGYEKDKNCLQIEINKLKVSLDSATKEIQSQKQELSASKDYRSECEKKVEEMQAFMSTKEERIRSLTEAKAKVIQDLKELNQKLTEISQEKADLSKDAKNYSKATEEIAALQQRIVEMAKEKMAISKDSEIHTKTVEQLNKTKEQLARITRVNMDLLKEIEMNKHQQIESQAKIKELQGIISAKEEKIQSLNKDSEAHAKAEEQLNKAKEQLTNITRENMDLRNKIKESRELHVEYERKIHKLQEIVSTKEEKIQSLNKDAMAYANATQSIDQLKLKISELTNEKMALSNDSKVHTQTEEQLNKTKEQLAKLTKENTDLHNKIKENSEFQFECERKIEELTMTVSTKEERILALNKDSKTYTQTEEQLNKAKQQLAKLTKENTDLHNEIKESKEHQVECEGKIQELQEIVSAKEGEIQSLNKDALAYTNVAENIDQLKLKISELTKEKMALLKDSETHAKTAEQLNKAKEQLAKIKKENTDLHNEIKEHNDHQIECERKIQELQEIVSIKEERTESPNEAAKPYEKETEDINEMPKDKVELEEGITVRKPRATKAVVKPRKTTTRAKVAAKQPAEDSIARRRTTAKTKPKEVTVDEDFESPRKKAKQEEPSVSSTTGRSTRARAQKNPVVVPISKRTSTRKNSTAKSKPGPSYSTPTISHMAKKAACSTTKKKKLHREEDDEILNLSPIEPIKKRPISAKTAVNEIIQKMSTRQTRSARQK